MHVIQAYADFLSDAFTDRAFEANKTITGVQEQQPRWKRAVATISGSLGETIGKLYVKEYFPETSKQRVYRLVKDLQQAFEDRMKQEPLGIVEGFTPAQRFYLAYARVWACNSTPEYTAMLVNSDVHSPARLRVMAALPMIDTWYEAFGIKSDAKMFIPKEKRALVW